MDASRLVRKLTEELSEDDASFHLLERTTNTIRKTGRIQFCQFQQYPTGAWERQQPHAGNGFCTTSAGVSGRFSAKMTQPRPVERPLSAKY
jgi:hypothetical protein